LSLTPSFPGIGLATAFAAAMDRIGPFEPNPALAVGVSGGPDSMALAILAHDWTRHCGGSILALIVDHALREGSDDEARMTLERLRRLGIPGRMLRLSGLHRGASLAERARIMRYNSLTRACAEAGILHLLLGHQAADQAETLAMRVVRGSRMFGLAGMAALRETAGLRWLRPLLAVEPTLLRHFLITRDTGWIEDPSNRDLRALRPRLRQRLAFALAAEAGFPAALAATGRLRRQGEEQVASELAERVMIRPEGFALLSPGRISARALAALFRMLAGTSYPPGSSQIEALAARLRPATLGGVRILPAGRFATGRFGDGMLLVREEAAIAKPAAALHGAIWDGRFRVIAPSGAPVDASVAKLGREAPRFRRDSDLPSAVLRTLPALWIGENLVSVPHLRYIRPHAHLRVTVLFAPKQPAGGPAFVPAA
jgi:tRNA(Ile)-lysidine synthase